MSNKNKPQTERICDENNTKNSTYVHFFISIGLLVMAAIAFGCTFIPNVGVYTLIASILLELAALSFLSTQKRKNNFRGVKYATVAAYILLGLSTILFAGGLIYSATR